MSVLVQIADAVVAELNAAGFSRPFTAVRSYRPRFELSELETLRVSVVARNVEIEVDSRDPAAHQHDYQVEVAVQTRIAEADAAHVDPLMDLVEEIADFWRGRVLDDPDATCIALEQPAPYFLPHLTEMHVFTSVVTLTFRMRR